MVYTTTSGIVRKTFYNCKKVKQILRTHMVKYDELDLFGDAELQTELRDRLGSTVIQLPQLFIDGQHIGVSKFIMCIYSYYLTCIVWWFFYLFMPFISVDIKITWLVRDMLFNLNFYLNNVIIIMENSCNFEMQMLAWIIKGNRILFS